MVLEKMLFTSCRANGRILEGPQSERETHNEVPKYLLDFLWRAIEQIYNIPIKTPVAFRGSEIVAAMCDMQVFPPTSKNM